MLAFSVCPSTVEPLIAGRTVLTGAMFAMTTVAADVAFAEPTPFVAVTATRIVEPTSAAPRTYVVPVAPAMSTQLAPAALQRRQTRVKVIVAVPTQVPSFAVSVWPNAAVPVIDGATVLTGGEVVTSAVWFDVASVLPAVFVAVTRLRIVLPTSAALST